MGSERGFHQILSIFTVSVGVQRGFLRGDFSLNGLGDMYIKPYTGAPCCCDLLCQVTVLYLNLELRYGTLKVFM